MNIWYISKYASPAKYFFGTRHFYLAEEWVKMGHSIDVITSNSSHLTDKLPQFKSSWQKEDINGVNTVWLNVIKSKSSSGISRLLSWLHFDLKLLFFSKTDLKRPDVIIVSSLALTTLIPGWLLSRWYNSRLVFEVRDIWPLSIMVLGGFSKYNPFIYILGLIEKFGYERADLIVGTMPNLREHVRSVTSRSAKCICIPQGLSVDFYLENQHQLDTDYVTSFLPDNKFIVCYAGTINMNNPLGALIEAAKLLTEHDIHFVILGKGDKKAEITNAAFGLKNVSFPPPIPKNKVNDFLSRVDICYDSFDSELGNFGLSRNKWIDYMYAAKPIICSFDGFPSMLNEAGCGDFVAFNDSNAISNAILTYYRMDVKSLKEMGLKGRSFLFQERTFDKLAKNYINEISNIKSSRKT